MIINRDIVPELCWNIRPALNIDPASFTVIERERIQRFIDEDTDAGIRTLQLKMVDLVNEFRLERAALRTQLHALTHAQVAPALPVADPGLNADNELILDGGLKNKCTKL